MSFDSEMNQKLQSLTISLEINIKAKAQRTALSIGEYIETLRNSGVADAVIKQRLLEDLNEGGRIFGEFFRGLGVDMSGRIGQLSREAANLRFGFKKTEVATWIAVSIQEGDKACPDCTPRHGESDTFYNWTLRGLPKTGWSVCRTNCKCVLMKQSDVDGEESLKSPIQVIKGE